GHHTKLNPSAGGVLPPPSRIEKWTVMAWTGWLVFLSGIINVPLWPLIASVRCRHPESFTPPVVVMYPPPAPLPSVVSSGVLPSLKQKEIVGLWFGRGAPT